MSITMEFLVFGGLLIILAIIAVGIFAIGFSRRTIRRRQSDELAGKGRIPRDPTISSRANNVEDAGGNFTHSVSDTQDTKRD